MHGTCGLNNPWHQAGLEFLVDLTRDDIGRSTRNSNLAMTSSTGSSAKGCSDYRFRAPPAYIAQLLTLHQHRANNQYRMANQI